VQKLLWVLIWIIKKERRPTSFSNWRHLELIWIIKKERKPTSFSNWRHLELIWIIKKETEIYSGADIDSSQISWTKGIWNCCQFISNFSNWRHYFEVFLISGSFGARFCIKGNHNMLNLYKLRDQLQVLAHLSIVSFYKIWWFSIKF
jgi:hypothetical protein